MTYQVLARKWRPREFSSLIGQQAVVTALTNALREGRIAQAYLFSGIRGVGKTTAARLFAKALNCELGPERGPCNECTTCRERNYTTEKNRRNDQARLELRKYCPRCRVHAVHRETK